ncbi:PREDICTED: beta-1,4 N-acetylgalactosaminyltransferase 1-like isoform X2 [Branchiostoma belcheri]|uniref:Beta-1,4 N-acetylgalactosaminyltransferase 1-like isoform X2 n=1 Tax=Branchiostoma belcheri TaxID=7741 RepID=A0A6P4YV65_BRABE|nr:PREDICTED: beta-1,4 N-acetylgalactosaminyltransferase 1-like isoform X2 [Branchiostoma belcheri]
MTATAGDKKLFMASLISFVTGSMLVYLDCWLLSPSCYVNVYTKTVDVEQSRVPPGYTARAILRPLKNDEERPLPSTPVYTGLIGEKPCECVGFWHKDFYTPKQWTIRLRNQEKCLQRYERRKIVLKSVQNYVDGSSPISYPSHGVYVRPLRAVQLDGLRISWFPSKAIITNAVQTVKLQCEKGIFRRIANVSNVDVLGEDTSVMTIQTSKPLLLNRQLRRIVYQNTVFDTNAFDLVKVQYKKFSVTIPIHIRHRLIPWLYEQGSGTIRDRVSVVVKTFLRYSNLRRLVRSVADLYPGTRVIVADDTPSQKFESFQDKYTDHYLMPQFKGFFAGRNLGLSQVTTEYFLYMDDDHYLKPYTKLEVLVALLDRTDFHVVGGVYEDLEMFATTIRVLGNSTHACYEKLRGWYHSVTGFPGCYAVDHTENFFLASTAEVKAIGFDPHVAQSRLGHQEFFTAGLGRLRIAVCSNIIVGHNKTTEGLDDKLYQQYRVTDRAYRNMRIRHHLFRDNLTCVGVKYPRNLTLLQSLRDPNTPQQVKDRREKEGWSFLKGLLNESHSLHGFVHGKDED